MSIAVSFCLFSPLIMKISNLNMNSYKSKSMKLSKTKCMFLRSTRAACMANCKAMFFSFFCATGKEVADFDGVHFQNAFLVFVAVMSKSV